jgi:hypothetical protein
MVCGKMGKEEADIEREERKEGMDKGWNVCVGKQNLVSLTSIVVSFILDAEQKIDISNCVCVRNGYLIRFLSNFLKS